MLTVLTWLWSQPGYRSKFTAEHVNILKRMVARNLTIPHTFVCITDTQRTVIDADIEVFNTPRKALEACPPRPDGQPNCSRRLWTFSADATAMLGIECPVLALDLDCVITGALDPLIQPLLDDESPASDMKMWGDTARMTLYNGSMLFHKLGTRRFIWEAWQNNPAHCAAIARGTGAIGSDQAWLTTILGRSIPFWTKDDGVLSFRNNVAMRPKRDLPAGARVVFFHGKPDPWDASVRRDYPWIGEHHR